MDLSTIPTSNLVNAVMDVLFRTHGMTEYRRDYELLDTGWMGGVDGVLFFVGVAELKRRLEHMPIADLIVREKDDYRRGLQAKVAAPEAPGPGPIMSKGKDC